MRRTFVPLACAALISSLAQAQPPGSAAPILPDPRPAQAPVASPLTLQEGRPGFM